MVRDKEGRVKRSKQEEQKKEREEESGRESEDKSRSFLGYKVKWSKVMMWKLHDRIP